MHYMFDIISFNHFLEVFSNLSDNLVSLVEEFIFFTCPYCSDSALENLPKYKLIDKPIAHINCIRVTDLAFIEPK